MDMSSGGPKRNTVAFWLLGLCNNFAYVVMLSAAKDILEKEARPIEKTCREAISSRECHLMSTGSVLLADIIPALIVKLTAPVYIQRVPFGVRHLVVVSLQAASFAIVGVSENTTFALFGVVLASFGSGLGEISYLALTSNYPSSVVASWSSGTGGAGLIGALVYAVLTDPKVLAVSPKRAMLLMLVVPCVFSVAFWHVLRIPRSVHRADILNPKTWLVAREEDVVVDEAEESLLEHSEDVAVARRRDESKIQMTWPLLKFMLPLISVYLAEYYINQGLLELLEFDCAHGLRMSSVSQYRWFQVIYQLGVFVSRSSSNWLTIPTKLLPLLAILQVLNAIFFTAAAVFPFLPHILTAFAVIFFEGLLGGASYVNTFRAVHTEIAAENREFSMGVVSISDTIGIVFAGFLAMPVHNRICSMPLVQ